MTERNEGFVSMDEDDLRQFNRMDRTAQRQQTEFMNELATNVVEGGGYCDETTFIKSFFAGVRANSDYRGKLSYDRSGLPEKVQFGLAMADKLRFSQHEPFMGIFHHNGFASTEIVGVVLGSERDEYSPVVEYRIDDTREQFIGQVVFGALEMVDKGWPKQPEPKLRNHAVLELRRSYQNTAPEQETTLDDEYVFGMPDIRRALYIDSHYIFKGILGQVESRVQVLREEVQKYPARIDIW